MMVKYDGWTIKELRRGQNTLYASDFREKRTDVILEFDRFMGEGEWRKYRRKGLMKIVRVKLVEVE